ncbi:hypothetical protein [Streptomyces sp. NPDC057910]|uniref:hypothetical protein n=1 Tax=Streptomyces sp. NPDC057910 TaxID=3346278 RepID=UPI0036E2A25F
MTTDDVTGIELTGQAQDVWAILAPALQDSDGTADLAAPTYRALQSWPAHDLPHDLWTQILGLLPLEDQTRLAHTSHHAEGILERLAPQALDPTAHTTTGFIRTIYAQSELNDSLDTEQVLAFIPGTGSDLTIGRGLAHVHGPGTLTAVAGGTVYTRDQASVITVTDGTVYADGQAKIGTVAGGEVGARDEASVTTVTGGDVTADGQAKIGTVAGGEVGARDEASVTTVTGGYVTAVDQASVDTVAGGTVSAFDQASIEEVTRGTVTADGQARITTVTGGTVTADGQASVIAVAGGTVTARGNATVTAKGGDAHIVAHDDALVIIEAGADLVCVEAYDAAHITAHSGTVTIQSPDVTITSNGHAVINHA